MNLIPDSDDIVVLPAILLTSNLTTQEVGVLAAFIALVKLGEDKVGGIFGSPGFQETMTALKKRGLISADLNGSELNIKINLDSLTSNE